MGRLGSKMGIDLKGLNSEEMKELLPENLILLGYRGSIAHGMYVPSSDPTSIDDKDIMGVFIAPLSHYAGIHSVKETKESFIREWDAVHYEFRKLIRLLIKGNPNVLSLLWLDDNKIIYNTKWGVSLRENRKLFASKQVYHSFAGYAHGQFKRMTHFKFEGYMGEKRKKLVESLGYDSKNASHLLRLLKMGIEFLNEGTLYVERKSDSDMLLSVKRGEWTLEKVQEEANRLFHLCEESYIKSTLPSEPDYEKIDEFCMETIASYHRREHEKICHV